MSDKPQALIHVVEDDAAVSRLITATLERFGYRHAAFSTGGDFLRQYIRDPQSLRRWPQGRMPGFSEQVLPPAELQHLITYLRHMAQRKSNTSP